MSRYGQTQGPPYLWPLAFDGDIGFVEVDTLKLLEEAERFFELQWDWVHGYIWAEDLEELPVWWEGYELVRTPRELSELARTGAFAEIAEIYRELYG